MPNEEFLKKITGDFTDELGESGYRTAANLLVNLVMVEGIKRLLADNPSKKKWPFGFLRRRRDDDDVMLNLLYL